MTMEEDARKLSELRVIDLKTELERRNMDKSGNKTALVDRLKKAMMDEGLNPDIHIFSFADKKFEKSPASKSVTKNDDIEISITESEDHNGESTIDDGDNNVEQDTEEALEDSIDDTNAPDDSMTENVAHADEDDQTQEQAAANTDDSNEETTMAETDANENAVKEKSAEESTSTAETPATPTKGKEEEKNTAESDSQQEAANKKREGATKTGASNTSSSSNAATGGGKTEAQLHMEKVLYALSRNLWITNISQNTRATELKQILSKHGKVVGAKVVINARYPGANCYGFVKMDSIADAERCIKHLDRTLLNGQVIRVEKVHPEHLNSLRRLPLGAGTPVPVVPTAKSAKEVATGTPAPKATAATAAAAATTVLKTTEDVAAASATNDDTTNAHTSKSSNSAAADVVAAVAATITDEQPPEGKKEETPKQKPKAAEKSDDTDNKDRVKEKTASKQGKQDDSATTAAAASQRRSTAAANKVNTPADESASGCTDPVRTPAKRARSRQESVGTSSERSAKTKDTSRDSTGSTATKKSKEEVLTLEKIREEREREQRARERERLAREEKRRREEAGRQRAIELQQRREQARLDREREELRVEREKLERAKAELMHIERERQKLEREKIELEKMELQQVRMRMQEEERRAVAATAAVEAAQQAAARTIGIKRSAPFPREIAFEDRGRGGKGGPPVVVNARENMERREYYAAHAPAAPRFSDSARDKFGGQQGKARSPGGAKHKMGNNSGPSNVKAPRIQQQEHVSGRSGNGGGAGVGLGGSGGGPTLAMRSVHPGGTLSKYDTTSFDLSSRGDRGDRGERDRDRDRDRHPGDIRGLNSAGGRGSASNTSKYSGNNVENVRYSGRDRSRSPNYRREEGRRGAGPMGDKSAMVRTSDHRFDHSKSYKVESSRSHSDSRSSGSAVTGAPWNSSQSSISAQQMNKSWAGSMKDSANNSWHRSGGGQVSGGGSGDGRWFNSSGGGGSSLGSSHRGSHSGGGGGVVGMLVQQFSSGNSSGGGPSCPPPPGINNYNTDRFDFKSGMAMRKY